MQNMDIDVKELKEKLDKGEDFVLIDVREPYEHEEFNVGGDLIPLGQITAAMEDLEDHKEDEIVVYCRSGRRSGIAKELMQQVGFKNVRNLEGGMVAWAEAFGTQKK
jgi:rhodanese-related sulfurtransferase